MSDELEAVEQERLRREREINSLMYADTCWEDEAACIGDDRFTQADPPAGLEPICNRCPVFRECSSWAVGKSGVFAAGKWRDDEP